MMTTEAERRWKEFSFEKEPTTDPLDKIHFVLDTEQYNDFVKQIEARSPISDGLVEILQRKPMWTK